MQVGERRGWDAYGIERNKSLGNYATERLGGRVINDFFDGKKTTDSAGILRNNFNYILIDNVLEHVGDPLKFLTQAFDLLDTKGVLVVAVPPVDRMRILLSLFGYVRKNIASANLNIFSDPEEHINYFSRKSIYAMKDRIGGSKLLQFRYHHKLSPKMASFLSIVGIETGYYFFVKQ